MQALYRNRTDADDLRNHCSTTKLRKRAHWWNRTTVYSLQNCCSTTELSRHSIYINKSLNKFIFHKFVSKIS